MQLLFESIGAQFVQVSETPGGGGGGYQGKW